MFVTGHCDIKINLTLRILDKRADGYHNICSLFWRRSSPETLQADFYAERDRLIVTGAEIPGENILTVACRHIRSVLGDGFLPPVEIILHKCLPMGGGVGAGSGNAAAFLRLVRMVAGSGDDLSFPGVASLGADVSFLASGYSLAIGCGVGDVLHGIEGDLNMSGLIFFPSWSVGTAQAYRMLDEARAVGRSVSESGEEQARDEAEALLDDLRYGRTIGGIPNDFMTCAGHEDEYAVLEDLASSSGASVWGLCGSGSGYFALFRPQDAAIGMQRVFYAIREKKYSLNWLRQILVLE
jgi:4-diphosphocytidyl-2-C-methyl-D-erythritol kinase